MDTSLFIINPVSGTNDKKGVPDLIKTHFKGNYEIQYTQHAGHATTLAQEAAKNGMTNVIAVGGDGTINETARGLINTNTNLGIIPFGSGNGLARHLGIPTHTKKAILLLQQAKAQKIDTAYINNHCFLCTAGLGLDAEITHDFAKRKTRGLKTYILSGLSIFSNIKNRSFTFQLDGKTHQYNALLFTIANASQYGNNAYISPLSSVKDGTLELCIVPKLNIFESIAILIRLFNSTLHQSKKITYYSFKELEIFNKGKLNAHIDGEPIFTEDNIKITVSEKSLSVLF